MSWNRVISLVKHRKQGNQLRIHSYSDPSQFRVEIRVAFTLATVVVVFIVCFEPKSRWSRGTKSPARDKTDFGFIKRRYKLSFLWFTGMHIIREWSDLRGLRYDWPFFVCRELLLIAKR